jgi:hypothetical protein
MGDDRPYLERCQDDVLLELPIDWRLDDAAYLYQHLDWEGGASDIEAVLAHWWEEFEYVLGHRGLLTLTMHPECIGRGARLVALETLIERMQERADVWFASHGQVAERVLGTA